ncbi:MAG: hypothetical protein JSS09_03890, partial [Verrucomicrobia bacterium]|nr:hypothetical protein [Verrucomicrobiota bacterium]
QRTFPERPGDVKRFFLQKGLLSSFTSQQVDKVCLVLAGRTVTPLDLTSILYGSVEEERRGREGGAALRSQVDFQKADIIKAVEVVKRCLKPSES